MYVALVMVPVGIHLCLYFLTIELRTVSKVVILFTGYNIAGSLLIFFIMAGLEMDGDLSAD